MMLKERAAAVAAAVGAALLIAACGSSSSSSSTPASSGTTTTAAGTPKVGNHTIGLLDISAASPSDARSDAVIKAAVNALGWNLDLVDAAGDPAKAAAGMQTLVNQGVSGIMTQSVDAALVRAGLLAAKSKNIQVCQLGGQLSPTNLYNAIYAESESTMGSRMAQYINQTVPDAKVISLVSTVVTGGAIRYSAFKTTLATNPRATNWEYPIDLTNPIGSTTQALKSALTAHPDANVVYAEFDNFAAPAVQAAAQRGSKAAVVSYYATPPNQHLLQSHPGLTAVVDANVPVTGLVCLDQFLKVIVKHQAALDPNALQAAGGIQYSVVTSKNFASTLAADPAAKTPAQQIAPWVARWKSEYGV